MKLILMLVGVFRLITGLTSVLPKIFSFRATKRASVVGSEQLIVPVGFTNSAVRIN